MHHRVFASPWMFLFIFYFLSAFIFTYLHLRIALLSLSLLPTLLLLLLLLSVLMLIFPPILSQSPPPLLSPSPPPPPPPSHRPHQTKNIPFPNLSEMKLQTWKNQKGWRTGVFGARFGWDRRDRLGSLSGGNWEEWKKMRRNEGKRKSVEGAGRSAHERRKGKNGAEWLIHCNKKV